MPRSGSVLLKRKGRAAFTAIRHPAVILIGSTVDVSHGTARLTTAKKRRGAAQSGTFLGGAFVVRQQHGSALTTLDLVDGAMSACPTAARAGTGAAVAAAGHARRRLFGRAHGHFRTRGRNSSATIRGTTWITEDLCSGSTRVSAIAGGHVEDISKSGSHRLRPGETAEDYCNFEPPPEIAAVASYYCMGVQYGPNQNGRDRLPDVVSFTLITGFYNPVAAPPASADACVTPAGDSEHCTTYRITDPPSGAIISDGCSLRDGIASYDLRWRLGGIFLPPTMSVRNSLPSTVHEFFGCLDRPTFPPYDAPVDDPGNEYEPR